MRKSQGLTGFRPWRAGIAVAATAAVVLAGTATAAHAVAPTDLALSTNVTQVATQGGTPITFSSSTNITTFTDPTFQGWFTTAASCPATGSMPSANATNVQGGTGITTTATVGSTYYFTIVTPALTAGTWRYCLYNGNATPVLSGHSGDLKSLPFAKLSQMTGSTAGGDVIALTAPDGTYGTSVATQFNTSACPNLYATTNTSTILAATTSRVSTSQLNVTVPKNLTAASAFYVCNYNGSTAGTSTLVARGDVTYAGYVTTTTANATALPSAALTPSGGKTGGTNSLTISVPADTVSGASPAAIFSRYACPNAYPTILADTGQEPFAATTTTKISSSKVAVKVPTGVVISAGDATTPWNLCLYASSAGNLIALPAVYTVAPTLNVASATLSPSSGPAQGGTRVTVAVLAGSLQGIPTNPGNMLSATLGGSPMNDLKVIDANSFSGVSTMHAPGVVSLSVTTAAGTQSLASAFTYSYGITVTPNTAAPASTAVVLDVMGAGFQSLDWTAADFTAADSSANNALVAKARVLLTDNEWNQQAALTNGTGVTAFSSGMMPIAQCGSVLVISDNELICTLNLTKKLQIVQAGGSPAASDDVDNDGGPVAAGTYTVTVINTGATTTLKSASYNYSVVSSGSTFTIAAF